MDVGEAARVGAEVLELGEQRGRDALEHAVGDVAVAVDAFLVGQIVPEVRLVDRAFGQRLARDPRDDVRHRVVGFLELEHQLGDALERLVELDAEAVADLGVHGGVRAVERRELLVPGLACVAVAHACEQARSDLWGRGGMAHQQPVAVAALALLDEGALVALAGDPAALPDVADIQAVLGALPGWLVAVDALRVLDELDAVDQLLLAGGDLHRGPASLAGGLLGGLGFRLRHADGQEGLRQLLTLGLRGLLGFRCRHAGGHEGLRHHRALGIAAQVAVPHGSGVGVLELDRIDRVERGFAVRAPCSLQLTLRRRLACFHKGGVKELLGFEGDRQRERSKVRCEP